MCVGSRFYVGVAVQRERCGVDSFGVVFNGTMGETPSAPPFKCPSPPGNAPRALGHSYAQSW